jgi:hypothetical protein
MDRQDYMRYLRDIDDATKGRHRLLGKFYIQAKKPLVIGFWAERIVHEWKLIFNTHQANGIKNDYPDENELKSTKITETAASPLSDPAEIIKIKLEAKALHKEESALHFKLCKSTSVAVRYDLAKKIIEVGYKLDGIYNSIRDYNKSGIIPISVVQKPEDMKDLFNKLNSLKSRVSRLKKIISNTMESLDVKKYEAEMRIKTHLIKEINQKIYGKA